MKNEVWSPRRAATAALLAAGVAVTVTLPLVMAQSPELQEKLAAIKESAAQNQKALATYTWQEQQTISLKGEQKSQTLYQVQIGPDGKQQKVDLSPPPQPPQQEGLRKHRVKEAVIADKTQEMKEYGQQIAALVHSYVPPNPQQMQEAFQKGQAALAPGAGDVSLKFTNYNKPGDSLTLVFSTAQKAIQSVQVSSYLSDPSDAVTLSAQFAKLPDGTNYMAMATVNGVKKQLTIQIQDINYRKIGS
jgi:hypothetical protein